MDDNNYGKLYRESMNSINVSDELMNKIKYMEIEDKKKKYTFRFVPILAACLVIVIFSGIIFGISPNKKGNSFVLKVGASEIVGDAPVEICELYSNMSADGFLLINGKEYDYMCRSCPLKVVCEGDNIKTVKYTIENGVFIFPLSSYAKDLVNDYPKSTEFTNNIYNKVEAEEKIQQGFENDLQYSSYTVNYEDQLELEMISELDYLPVMVSSQISMADEDLSDEAKVLFDYDFGSEYDIPDITENEELMQNVIDYYVKVNDEIFKRVRITVDVTYEDGTVDSKTFELGCSGANEYEGFIIDAQLVVD